MAHDQSDEARRLKAAEKSPPFVVEKVPRIPSGKLARRIVAFLRQDPARTYTPTEITQAVHAPKADVKKELCRLLLRGRDDTPPPVQRQGRGLYGCFLGARELNLLENPQPKVHALQLVWRVPSSPPNGGSPPRPPGSRVAVLDAGFGELHGHRWIHDAGSRSYRLVRWYGALQLTLQCFPTTGTLMASTSSSEAPFDGPGLNRLRAFLEATLQAEGFPWLEPQVKTVEINRDYKRVRLVGREVVRFFSARLGISGERDLSLQQLEGALIQIYQKGDLMRQEIRLQPRDLDMANLEAWIGTLAFGPTPGPVVPQAEPEGGYS